MSQHCLATDDDSAVQQAFVSIKKGAYLLKCGQRGKPKFCAFKLSPDEKFLIWYSGKEERQLRLSSTTRIIPGQKTFSFKRHIQPERECQSFSLVYAKGKRSLDLICKDKVQSDYWISGLRAVISRCHHGRPLDSLRSCRGVQSCVNSPAGVFRRKQTLGLLDDATEYSQETFFTEVVELVDTSSQKGGTLKTEFVCWSYGQRKFQFGKRWKYT